MAKGKLFSLKVSVRSIPIGQKGMSQKLLVGDILPSLITGLQLGQKLSGEYLAKGKLFSLKVSVRSIPFGQIGMILMRLFSL